MRVASGRRPDGAGIPPGGAAAGKGRSTLVGDAPALRGTTAPRSPSRPHSPRAGHRRAGRPRGDRGDLPGDRGRRPLVALTDGRLSAVATSRFGRWFDHGDEVRATGIQSPAAATRRDSFQGPRNRLSHATARDGNPAAVPADRRDHPDLGGGSHVSADRAIEWFWTWADPVASYSPPETRLMACARPDQFEPRLARFAHAPPRRPRQRRGHRRFCSSMRPLRRSWRCGSSAGRCRRRSTPRSAGSSLLRDSLDGRGDKLSPRRLRRDVAIAVVATWLTLAIAGRWHPERVG